MEDKRDVLKQESPFSWSLIKKEKAFIYWNNKKIKTLEGKDLSKLLLLIDKGNDFEIQLFLAKKTGNFKHGNEKNKRR